MGLFSSSKSSTSLTENITTNTITTLRDIGLTGDQAVQMAGVIQGGEIERSAINAGLVDRLVQTVGQTAQQLIGGAGEFVQTGQKQLAEQTGLVKEVTAAATGVSNMEKWIPIAMIAFAAYMVLRGGVFR